MVKLLEVQKCESPLENFHMVSTLEGPNQVKGNQGKKLKIWRNAKMPSKMSDNADIICVEHCEQKIFAVGSFPGTCSQCQINLKDCDLKIPPFSVPTPFSRWVYF